MTAIKARSASIETIQALAEFRHRLRLFLHFSETAAGNHGLQSQQHQLMLQIAGAPAQAEVTVGYLAERLGLRHHSVVELCDRCGDAGLLKRRQDEADRRRVLLELTSKGRKLLESLSREHAEELNELMPQLIRTLEKLRPAARTARKAPLRRPA